MYTISTTPGDRIDTAITIPEALAELMRQPGTVNVPLDDVVPGEPAHVHEEVRA